MAKLVAIKLNRLPAGLHGDGGGLYLQVTASGARSWVFRFMLHGRARSMGLGPLHIVSLAEARVKAGECRRLRYEGVDPIEARRGKRAKSAAPEMTFKACAERYIEAHQAGWRNTKHSKQWPSSLEAYAYPVIGSLHVHAINVELVLKVLKPIWTAKPETASRVRGRVETVLDWAASMGYRAGENPARWRGHLENLLPKRSKVQRVEHHAALPYAELPGFIAELRQQSGTAARALEFAVLTAARTGEVIGAKWDEVDLTERMWTVPAERMKSRKEHRVPLSTLAIEILAQMQTMRVSDFVFPGSKSRHPIGVTTIFKLLRRMGRGDLTAHGFRSTFSDWAAERTGFPSEVREMALAHRVGSAVEAAYRRGDLFEKRQALAEAWARFCDGSGAAGSVIIPLKGRVAAG